MMLFRRSLLLTLSLLLALFIVACGGSTPNTNTNSSASNTSTQTDKAADIQNNQAANDQKAAAADTTTAQSQGNAQNTGQKNTTNTAKTTQTQKSTKNDNQMQGNAGNTQQSNQSQKTQNTQNNQSQNNQSQNDQSQNGQMNGNGQNAGTNDKTLVSTKQVNLNGQMVTVLTTFNGQTLYTYNADMASNSSCTGACAQQWPPLLSNGQVISTTSITGNLTVHNTANGPQVTYNGNPLYTYAGDMEAGQINGQGVNNMWQVATVKLQKQHW
jgi:predicted lipoprotein with Yx(FWY)xxD motif